MHIARDTLTLNLNIAILESGGFVRMVCHFQSIICMFTMQKIDLSVVYCTHTYIPKNW